MSNQIQNSNNKNNKYDLCERTALFAEKLIDFVKTFEQDSINRPLLGQLIRSGTSIGANYMEADCAESKRDFKHKIGICRKESKETTHWLRMLARADRGRALECRVLWKEAHELTLIFSSIFKK